MKHAAIAATLLLADVGFADGHDISEAYAACIDKTQGAHDANCAYYDDAALGQAARLAAHECVLKLTQSRAFELEILRPE